METEDEKAEGWNPSKDFCRFLESWRCCVQVCRRGCSISSLPELWLHRSRSSRLWEYFPRPWLIPVATGNHERRALRNWWPHVHRDLGAATTVAHPRALKLVLFVLHARSTNENAPEPAQRLADMEMEQVSAEETNHDCCCCCCCCWL
jgi:hypothetical protein